MSVVGLIGKGIVGSALVDSFNSRGLKVIVYDKYKEIGKFSDLLIADIIFVCLPTPFKEDEGYDISSIDDTCRLLSEFKYNGIVTIKSTVIPGTCDGLVDKYKLKIVHNPEFLTARTAFSDFQNQSQIILGGSSEESLGTIKRLYSELYNEVPISVCSLRESEMAKILTNNFYAIKVQIFNEFYLLCKNQNIDYDRVLKLMLGNGWINPMHTKVPGPDGGISYGGMCFPKDTNALMVFMKEKGVPHEVLEATILERNKMRED